MTAAGVETLRAQVLWLARAIAASTVLMFLVVALPWLLRMIEIELAPLAWTLTAFAATHAALTFAADRFRTDRSMLRLLYAVPLLGVPFMALLWHYGGGVRNPALALAMILPIVATAALRNRFALVVALWSVAVVTVTVTLASADFGWYITQLGFPGAAFFAVAGDELLARDPFPGATTTPAATFVFVATFAVLQLAAAFVATRVAEFLPGREQLSRRLQEPVDDTLAAAAMETTPAAALTVIAATGQIVQATKRFTHQMLLHHDPILGRELLEVLTFAEAEQVRSIVANGGTIPFCRYRIGAEERIASVASETFEHDGITYASLLISDWNDVAWLAAAAEAVAEPLLVVGGDARLRYANRAAGELFDELYPGRDVTPLVGDWWKRQDGRTQQIRVADRAFDGLSTPLRLFGSDPASVIILTPARERA